MLFGMLAVMPLVQGCGYNGLVSLQQQVEKQWAQVAKCLPAAAPI